MLDSAVLAALASQKRLQVLQWLKDPVAHFPPQRDGDLIEDGVCVVFIARKLGVAQPTATAHLQALARAGLAEQGGGLAQRVADLILDGLAGAGLACQEHPVAHREAG